MGISQHDPVHFRVEAMDPFPMPDPASTAMIRLTFEVLSRATRRTYHLPTVWVVPYKAAVERAMASRSVYWADLDYSRLPDYPPPGAGDAIPLRLLKAVQNDQVVRNPTGRADEAAPDRSTGDARAREGGLALTSVD